MSQFSVVIALKIVKQWEVKEIFKKMKIVLSSCLIRERCGWWACPHVSTWRHHSTCIYFIYIVHTHCTYCRQYLHMLYFYTQFTSICDLLWEFLYFDFVVIVAFFLVIIFEETTSLTFPFYLRFGDNNTDCISWTSFFSSNSSENIKTSYLIIFFRCSNRNGSANKASL